MSENEIQKYSVWIPIETEEEASADLKSIIKEFAIKYNQPVFCPHVTVVSLNHNGNLLMSFIYFYLLFILFYYHHLLSPFIIFIYHY